jgi:hypothetical protein
MESKVEAEELADELRPFKENFLHYAPKALKIRTKAGTIEPFKLNQAQLYIHKRLQDQIEATGKVRALILKGRQQGASTYVEGRFYWRTSMQFGKQALILTHLQDSTDALFDMTKRYHDLCPDVLKPRTSAASAKELKFADLDSGYIVSTAGSKAVGRGRTIQYFHGSEAAFWSNAEEHLAGLGQAVPNEKGTEVILESTANGVGNVFHQLWSDAERGLSEFIPVFVPWFWQPEYAMPAPSHFELEPEETDYQAAYKLTLEQMVWRRMKVSGDFRGDVALFDQEYPATSALAFRRVSGDPLINPGDVAIARTNKELEPQGPRILGVDPAEYGRDSTAIAFRQGRVCHRIDAFNGKGPMEVVALVAMRADQWRPDAINVDCTGVGSGVADRLIELGYPVNRVHFGERAIEDQQYGIRRDEMWGNMREFFQNRPCSIPDDDALEQDLCAPQYTYDSSRRLKLESKENMRKRGIHSPDRADALALTFAVPMSDKPMQAQKFRGLREDKSVRSWRVS